MNGLFHNDPRLTLGGLATGLGILAWHLGRWWYKPGGGGGGKGGKGAPAEGGKQRDPKQLIPFGCGVGFGTLMVACPAGILGVSAGWIRGVNNAVGDKALTGATGAASQQVANAGAPHLDGTGALMVLVTLALVIALYKKVSKLVRGKFGAGMWCGATLGVASGLAGIVGQVLIPVYNSVGGSIVGAVV